MANKFPPIANGTIITTTRENLAIDNWDEGSKGNRRWGVRGEVIDYSSGHGLCYEIRHDDGSRAWYDPSEFHICMLAILHQVEEVLPDLLKDESIWKSVDVTYHPPRVERLWTPFGDYRICLHKIHPCGQGEALFHPHPWPSAVRILSGRYVMLVGFGEGKTPPPVAVKLILNAPDEYEMTDPNSWHSVRPREALSCSLLVTGPTWDRWAPRSDKPLPQLGPAAMKDILHFFRSLYC